jgi:hypothetical protein
VAAIRTASAKPGTKPLIPINPFVGGTSPLF